MRQLIFAVMTAFMLTACTKDQIKGQICEAGKTASTIVSSQIATQLSCKNLGAIQEDIEAKLVDLKVCEPATFDAKLGIDFGDIVCAPLVEGLFTGAVAQLPSKWECTGGPVAADAKAKLLEACKKAL